MSLSRIDWPPSSNKVNWRSAMEAIQVEYPVSSLESSLGSRERQST